MVFKNEYLTSIEKLWLNIIIITQDNQTMMLKRKINELSETTEYSLEIILTEIRRRLLAGESVEEICNNLKIIRE